MSARSIVLAAFACLLPLIATPQTAKPAADGAPGTKLPVKNSSVVSDLSAQGAVIEKMASTIRYAKDGSSVRTLTVAARMLSDAGVRNSGVLSYPFASSSQTLTFNYVRVRKPSGEVVETPVADAQDVPMPVTQQAPMYSDLRTKQLPVKSLSVGDTLEYALTIQETNKDTPGAFWDTPAFTTNVPVKEETIEVRVPRSLDVLVKSNKVQPTVTEEGDEQVYRWKHETLSEYPKKEETDKTAAVDTVQKMFEPDIAITSFHNWAEVGAWFRGLMKDRAVPDAAIQAKADELTRGLTTDEAKVDAIYHYVSTQYRYIAVSFGIGRLQPHTAAEVFRNQYGDCKDKHTLLEAMLAAEKIEADPVLIGSSVRLNKELPMLSQFDHVITLVKLKDRDVWLDSTPEVAPVGMLLVGLRDKLALAIPAAGDAKLVQTETAPPFPTFVRETITGKLEAGGLLTAHFDLTMRGDAEVLYRLVFHTVPRANWQTLMQQISYRNGFAGDVSAVDASVPEKTAEPFHVSWDYTRKNFGDWENRRFPGLSPWFEAKIAEDATPPKRNLLMDATGETEVKVMLTLPEGYSVTAPSNVKYTTPFAEYTSTYGLKDKVLTMDRTMHYKEREVAVSEFTAYRDFLKNVNDDAGQMLQLVGNSAVGTSTAKASNSQAAKLIEQSYQAHRSQDFVGARSLLNKARALNDEQSGLWAEYAALEWISNNKPEAEADYKKELRLHPENLWVYKQAVSLEMTDEKWTDARELLESWAKADPSNSQPYAELGSLEMEQKQYKDAEDSFKKAIGLSTASDLLKLQLGQAQLKAGDTDAGKAMLHALMDTSNDAEMLNDTSYELAEAGLDLPAAEAASQKAVALQETAAASVNLVNATNKDFATVVSLAAEWDTLGWIYFKENKLPKAESYVRSGWLLMMNPECGLHMGKVYEAEGKKDEALTAYRLALKFLGSSRLLAARADIKAEMESRAAALEKAGAHQQPGPRIPQVTDDRAVLRTYVISSPLHGEYASADFLLLLGDNRAEAVRLLKGDQTLEKAIPALEAATYRSPLPAGSKAKVLRRGIMACTTGSKICLLVLLPVGEARAD